MRRSQPGIFDLRGTGANQVIVAGTLAAGEVSVWLLQEEAFVAVADSSALPPATAAVALLPGGGSLLVSGTRAVAPIRGPRGDLLGALVADGKGDWDDV